MWAGQIDNCEIQILYQLPTRSHDACCEFTMIFALYSSPTYELSSDIAVQHPISSDIRSRRDHSDNTSDNKSA